MSVNPYIFTEIAHLRRTVLVMCDSEWFQFCSFFSDW